MSDIRVLVVDDSPLIRKFICDAIGAEPGVVVAGTAPNGRVALELLEELRPDVVTLDIEMPELSGLETLPELRRRRRDIPVIMFSTLTSEGAAATLHALDLGATDFVTKPSGPGNLHQAVEQVRGDLVPRIKALAAAARPTGVPAFTRPARPQARVDCVVIGVSTGGPRALDRLVPQLPVDLPVPILVVQHMPAEFTKRLAERLAERSRIAVSEATDGALVRPGELLIAPGGRHLTVARRGVDVRVALNDDAPQHSCRPSVCVMFRSALQTYGARLLAVVLTGMGDDGSDAASEIAAAGGCVLAQDEATSVVWGMPGAVVRAGVADAVLPLDALSSAIVRRAEFGRVARPSALLARRTAP